MKEAAGLEVKGKEGGGLIQSLQQANDEFFSGDISFWKSSLLALTVASDAST